MAHLHDFGAKILHSGIGASVLHTRLRIARSVHIRHKWNFLNSQRIDHNVYMNIAAAVVTVGMGTDDCLMSGKVFLAKFLTKALSQIYSQSMVGNIFRVKRNNIVMTFDIFPFLIFPVTEVSSQTGNRKIFVSAVQSGNTVILSWDEPAVFVQGGLHGKLIMLKGEISGGILQFLCHGRIGASPFVEVSGDLVEIVADPSVFSGQLSDGSKQIVVDQRCHDGRTDGCTGDGFTDKLRLAHFVKLHPTHKFGVLFIVQTVFYNVGSFRCVVGFCHSVPPLFFEN